MEDTSVNIKLEFEEKINDIEENEKKVNKLKVNFLNIVFVFSFLLVLSGTIISYTNYVKAKEKPANNNTVVEIKVVER